MTREEAATILYKEWQRFLEDNLDYAGISDAYKMAINTLKQGPCEDAISRADVKKYLSAPDANGDRVIYESDLDLLPSVTPQPCEDCISRKTVFDMCKKEIDHISKNWQNYHSPSEAKSGFAYIATNIYDLPPVNPQPKTGHWIRFNEFENGYYHIKCSECDQYWSIDGHSKIFRYCFNCGAKMTESEE